MSADRPDEKLAFAVVGEVLGVTVEEYDTAGRQNAIDALLHYSSGQIAALEVSSVGPAEEARITNVLASGAQRRRVAGLTQSWVVTISRSFHPADLSKIDQMLLRCEQFGVTDLKVARTDELTTEIFNTGVRGVAHTPASAAHSPTVWVLPEPLGGFIENGATELPVEVDTLLTSDTMRSKLTKLAASGYKEQHLFLQVRPSAFSFATYDNLSFGGSLPSEPPRLPMGLSQVWLMSGWKEGGVVRAITGKEWRRDYPFD
jgi:hypothetical protein